MPARIANITIHARQPIPPTSASTSRATTTSVASATACRASIESEQLGFWGPFEEFVIMMRDPEGNEFCLQ